MEDVLVMPFNTFSKARRGQSRILEAVIAAVVIFVVFSVSIYLLQPSVQVLNEKSDLDRLGYNVLHTLVESETIEKTLELDSLSAAPYLKTVIQRSLPSAIYFNLTIFNCTETVISPAIELKLLSLDINNTSADSFTKSIEVSSTNIIYTSKQGNIYYLVLMLARPGGAGEGQ
jgi:hypothetical protein